MSAHVSSEPVASKSSATVLSIENLTIDLPSWAERAHAVENVSVALGRDEIVCIVGESGSGKSVMARAALGLFPSRHVRPSGGRILFQGENLLAATEVRLRELRGSRIAMITLRIDGVSTATSRIANRKNGIVWKISVKRISSASTRPP